MMCPQCKKGVLDKFIAGYRCLRCTAAFDQDLKYYSVASGQTFKLTETPYKSTLPEYGPAFPEERKQRPYEPSEGEIAKHKRMLGIQKKPKKYKIGNSWI